MTRIKRRLLINCGPPNARTNCAILAHCRPFLSPALVIKMLIMVIVIRTIVITVVMMTIEHAMVITDMIRGCQCPDYSYYSAKTLVYDR